MKAKISQKLILALFSMVSTVMGCELLLHLVDYPFVQTSGWKTCRENCNALGYRGHSITYGDDDFVVLLVGDSQVATNAYHFDHMPETILQKIMSVSTGRSVKVFTVGDSGYGLDQEYLALKEYLRSYRADLVLHWFNPGNDVQNTLFPVSISGAPKPTFWLEGDQLQGPSEEIGDPVGSGFRLLSFFEKYNPTDRLMIWEKRTPKPYVALHSYEGELSDEWQKEYDLGAKHRFVLMELEMTTKAGFFTPPSARMKYTMKLMNALLQKMQIVTEEQGGKFASFFELRGKKNLSEKEQAYTFNGKIYLTKARQWWDHFDAIFQNVPHYPILIDPHNITVSSVDAHLNRKAIETVLAQLNVKLMQEEDLALLR